MFSIFGKKSAAPDWFVADKKNGVSEEEMQEKIRNEVTVLVMSNRYDERIWDKEFIDKVTELYYRFFEQLYSI